MPARFRSHPQNGFNLVELLIALAALEVVLASFTRIMGTEAKLSTLTGRNLGIQDSLSQASNLMRTEIAMASRTSTTSSTLTNPSTCLTWYNNLPNLSTSRPPILVLIGPGNTWQIAYSLRAATTLEKGRDWFGPSLLVRCGPSYISGALNTNTTSACYSQPCETVALDRLDSNSGLSISQDSGVFNLSAKITLTTSKTNEISSLSTSFQAGTAGNSLYDTPACTPSGYKCTSTDERETYITPSTWTGSPKITGDPSKEVVVYLPLAKEKYTFSSPCNTTSCTVSNFTMENVSLLAFADQEIRLPPP